MSSILLRILILASGLLIQTFDPVLLGNNLYSSETVPYENEGNATIAIDSSDKNRLKWSLALAGTAYTGTSYFLYDSWYKNYELTGFHFHDDLSQWRGMDKLGHIFSSYQQSSFTYDVAQWAGLDKREAIIWAASSSFLFQTTVEVFDGFSKTWGFSFSDYVANLMGIGLFSFQQSFLDNQPVRIKFSSSLRSQNRVYSDGQLFYRPDLIPDNYFGNSLAEKILKDYNSQKYWVSFNLKSFWPQSNIPDWLNFALGYSIENDFGSLAIDTDLTDTSYPEQSHFYISLDTDLSKVRTKSPFINTLLDILNILKTPFSALSIATDGHIKFHFISW